MSEKFEVTNKPAQPGVYSLVFTLIAVAVLAHSPLSAEPLPENRCGALIVSRGESQKTFDYDYLDAAEAKFFSYLPEFYPPRFQTLLISMIEEKEPTTEMMLIRPGVVHGVVYEAEFALASLWLLGQSRSDLRRLVQPLLSNFILGVSTSKSLVTEWNSRFVPNFKVAVLVGDMDSAKQISDLMYEKIPFSAKTINVLAELGDDSRLLELGLRLMGAGFADSLVTPKAVGLVELAVHALSRVRSGELREKAREELLKMAEAVTDPEFASKLRPVYSLQTATQLLNDYLTAGLAAIEGAGDIVTITRADSGEKQWSFHYSHLPSRMRLLTHIISTKVVESVGDESSRSILQLRRTLAAIGDSRWSEAYGQRLFHYRQDMLTRRRGGTQVYLWAFDLFFDSKSSPQAAAVLQEAIRSLGTNEFKRTSVSELAQRVIWLNDAEVRKALLAKLIALGWTYEEDLFLKMEQRGNIPPDSKHLMLANVPPGITVALRAVEARLDNISGLTQPHIERTLPMGLSRELRELVDDRDTRGLLSIYVDYEYHRSDMSTRNHLLAFNALVLAALLE